MSKQGKRKITVELPKSKDLNNRPSVFERLGTKKSGAKKTTEFCRQWSQHGTCAYGKSCKFASTHILISPSKQRAAKDNNGQKKISQEEAKNRLHSTVIVRSGRSPDGDIDDNWDQNDLEYADADVLEKRRQQLQRELEIQLKMDGKDMRKDKKKPLSSSSSSRSSSSSSFSSSTSDNSSSSSSSGRDVRKKGKKKLKRNSSSSSGDGPPKKKILKSGSSKRDKSVVKKSIKKEDKNQKKQDLKKKLLPKPSLSKKSLSPGKKSGGTPPISSKNMTKAPKTKSPVRKNRSVSPREKERERKEKEREKDRDKEKDKNRARSRSRKARSRSQRRHGSNPKDTRRKESAERGRPISPKKAKKDSSIDKHRKRSASRERERAREHKDKSLERRKDKNDDKDRHDRKDRVDRGRDRNKDTKRDDNKRRTRDRGSGGGGSGGLGRNADKGLEKPNKPMERLLPRPEERLAALAAITNRNLDLDKNTTAKDRQDTHSDRGGRKQDRERDRSNKRDRLGSVDREPCDFNTNDRPYDRSHSMDRYKRGDERYSDIGRESERSPGYGIKNRDRHYDANFEMSGPSRGYPEEDDRMFGEHLPDRGDIGFDERRLRDRSWEGRRSGSRDNEQNYGHPRKDWDNEDYRPAGDWNRGERHWPAHDAQMNEWGDKDQEEGWHHRGHASGPQRGRQHGEFNRGGKRADNKWRGQKTEPEATPKESPAPAPDAQPEPRVDTEPDENPIPDDLSEISDDPDDILNRDDMGDQNDENTEVATVAEKPAAEATKDKVIENPSTVQKTNPVEEKECQDNKDEDENTNLDFEEISDGELEEERARGLGDALGVDWASLVADVRRREQPSNTSGGARDRWRPERVLARHGLSVEMAGAETVKSILQKHAEQERTEQMHTQNGDEVKVNGNRDEDKVNIPDLDNLHPVAVMQVAAERRKRRRAALFGVGCEINRALSARRDLALRRHLCRLPPTDRTPITRPTPHADLFKAACALLQAPVKG